MSVKAIAFAIMGLLISMGTTTYIMAKDMERIEKQREARQQGGEGYQADAGPGAGSYDGTQQGQGDAAGADAGDGSYGGHPSGAVDGSYGSDAYGNDGAAGEAAQPAYGGDSGYPAEQSYEDSALSGP